MKHTTSRLLALLLATILLVGCLAACGGEEPATQQPGTTETQPAATEAPEATGDGTT